MRRLPLALAPSLVTALVLATTPAYAETWRHTDASRDVIADHNDGTAPVLDPTIPESDLTRVTVRYDADGLQVASRVRALACDSFWGLRIATSRGDDVRLGRATYSSEGCMYSSVKAFRNGSAFTCDGMTVDRNAAGLVARVPRACLGSPYRVRVGVQATATHGTDLDDISTMDDVLRTGRYTKGESRLSSWIVGGGAA